LCNEYRFRYGESKIHKTEAHIDWLIANHPVGILNDGFTVPAQAMPDEYKDEDVIVAYRRFYIESKVKIRNIVTYKVRSVPDFLISI
jgi:hypothetical protein